MGAALARHLVEKNEGWHVMIADINSEGGEKVASSLNGNATFIQADCSNWEELRSLFAKTWDEHGRIDFGIIFHSCSIEAKHLDAKV
jgi:NAD(P)-dependent dehydrogenase (short-subunit alcohol dehydrogenase family)